MPKSAFAATHRSDRRKGRNVAASLLTGALAAASLALLLASAETAQAIPPGDIVLGDITVIKLRTGASGLTAQERADKVQERINLVLAVPKLTAKDVKVVNKPPYGPTIYIHGIKVITVDKADAIEAGTTTDELAKSWAHRLMGVISQVNIRLPEGTPKPAAPGTTTPALPGQPGDPQPGQPAQPASPPAAPPAQPAQPDKPPAAPPPATPPANPAPATPPATPTTPATPPATPPAATPATPPATPPVTPPQPPATPPPQTPPPVPVQTPPASPKSPAEGPGSL